MTENMNQNEKTVDEIIKECNWYTNEAANLILKLKFAGYSKYITDNHWSFARISWFTFLWENLWKFTGNLDEKIWLLLLEHGQQDPVLQNLNKFSSCDEILILVMNSCRRYFRNLIESSWITWFTNKEIVEKILSIGYGMSVVDNLSKLKWVDHKRLFDLLVEKYPTVIWEAICYWKIKYFEWIKWSYYDDRTIVYKLLEKYNARVWKWIAENINKFEDLTVQDYNDIAKKMIKTWEWKLVVENICKFKWLKWDVADMLVENWLFGKMAHNKKFGHLGVNKRLIWRWFKWRYPNQKTVDQLLSIWQWNVVAKYLPRFHGIKFDKVFALKMIEQWWGIYIFNNEHVWYFSRLSKADRKEIVYAALWIPHKFTWESISFWVAFDSMTRDFEDIEIYDLLNKMVDAGNQHYISKILNFISWEFDKEFLFKLLKSDQNVWEWIMDSFSKFRGLTDEDCREIAKILINKWEWEVVLQYRKKLKLTKAERDELISKIYFQHQ